jgi:hypothetical protein
MFCSNHRLQETKLSIAKAVDNIMTVHGKDKGIIHTTYYKQLNFIKENILDSAFGSFVIRNRDIFPDWFKQAIRSKVNRLCIT